MIIKPFRALRPVRDKAHLVATRPFYSYKKNILKAKMQSNPFSFLHIINPDFDVLSDDVSDLNRTEKHKIVRDQYQKFIENGVLIRDEKPSIYVYRQSGGNDIFTGIVATTNVQDYVEGKIKKHEATITAREKMFTDYLDTVGYNAEPVLLSHAPSSKLDAILEAIISQRPEYEFSTTDCLKHELWCVQDQMCEEITRIFIEIGVAYIAVGHNRCASSAALDESIKLGNNTTENDAYFLSFLIDETKLKVIEYNRLIKNRTDLSLKDILDSLEANFEIKQINEPTLPSKEHEIVMFTDNQWFVLNCKSTILKLDHPVNSLDADILTQQILSPIFGIEDLKTDKNVGFISGKEPIQKLQKKMKKGGFNIAFLLFPVNMQQIKKVADNDMIMPPKSTWVEPKLRSGLTVYCINE